MRNFDRKSRKCFICLGLVQRQKKAKAPFIIPKEKEQLSKIRYDDAAK